MTAAQAGVFAREARVEELVLIHFAARYKGQYEALVAEARAEFPGATADLG
jgi:ribonuclease BN (tRNA processing enzyme)